MVFAICESLFPERDAPCFVSLHVLYFIWPNFLEYKKQLHEAETMKQKFKELAKEFSDCSSAKRGGDLGKFKRRVMQKAFEDVAFGLKVLAVFIYLFIYLLIYLFVYLLVYLLIYLFFSSVSSIFFNSDIFPNDLNGFHIIFIPFSSDLHAVFFS